MHSVFVFSDSQPTKLPQVKPVLMFVFNGNSFLSCIHCKSPVFIMFIDNIFNYWISPDYIIHNSIIIFFVRLLKNYIIII